MITSVLITLYNHEKYIEFALNSLLKSNTKNIQLVVNDDCSQDNSYEIAENWINNHKNLFSSALIFKQSKNLGINNSINFLVSKAKGYFITILSSDDAFMPAAVDFQSQYLLDNPQFDFLFTNQTLMNEFNDICAHKHIGFRRKFLIKSNFFLILDMIFNWGHPWSKVFARLDSYKKMGPLPISISFDDRWIGFKILQAGKYTFLNKASILYRVRSDKSTTPGLNKKQILNDLNLVELEALKYSKGILFSLLFLYTLPLKLKSQNRLLLSIYKLPKKIIKKLYLLII
ncbi:WcaA Glycosyltransferases involved in cell wall biogenesis [Candidatus Methylopumilus planktonicus]|uniref:glycosyltransferase family A protein n=1 Tax=Candidatus Methylopumilus planktonicus TaxID=1581557 RepID=UPI003BEEEC99